ncbi:aldose epimerase [Stenotrophomonas sp. HITSZ_GD]|uniref:aldose 1-epimerase n=1 Tax=Stenotrophomonas sp. HITSZ_GD TaxID=3037248 RepID=UPI00240D16A8|nr:aldose epimerase [Stenotrophomonas sp. HITSZ_GD]MDG2524267.1 aldose epimerase [Stenotrophomonas sp. HITSZ_GD]
MTEPAMTPLPPGETFVLRAGALEVTVAPEAGGRLAQVRHAGRDWLIGPDAGYPGAISWGAYPMVPWAGRIRNGRFPFAGDTWQLPPSLGAHAIHGVGFVRRWSVVAHGAQRVVLALELGEGADWPFGGRVEQRIEVMPDRLRLDMQLVAGERAMPLPVLGWHPWFVKAERFDFAPRAYYPRDAEGIATLPLAPPPGPKDDCYLCDAPVALTREGHRLVLRSNGDHWVYYDETPHATCFEPQSGPPDAFNLRDAVLAPGASVSAWFEWEFSAV